jgi:rod shape-determining protein MreD
VFQGSLLGEHALALAFVTYLAIRLNLLVRAKPLFEQSLFVFAALMIYEFTAVGDRWLERPSAHHAARAGCIRSPGA